MTATRYGLWALALAAAFSIDELKAQEGAGSITVKGRLTVVGGPLLNPVWEEAAEEESHRYTFRAPSTTVSAQARVLSAYLPKELCIVALAEGAAQPQATPIPVHVSGGRTTPVTLVVAEGQNVQFINDDPFPHKLYDKDGVTGGLAPEEMAEKKQRTWKPPKAGVYEIRDQLFPSVRSWIVVEPRAAAFAHPTSKNEFSLAGLAEGKYELRAYFNGKPTDGDPLKLEVRDAPDVQELRDPLVVGKKKAP